MQTVRLIFCQNFIKIVAATLLQQFCPIMGTGGKNLRGNMVADVKTDIAPAQVAQAYPTYTSGEILADGIIHFLGVIGSIVGFCILLPLAAIAAVPNYGALVVYGVSVISLFCFSCAYHMTPWPEFRPILRRFDQSAIFFKIAGTYTPLVFLIGSTFAYSLLAVIWMTAILGAMAKLFTGDRLNKHTIIIYLALGWASVLLLWPLMGLLQSRDVWLLVIGGLLYTIGVYFHQSKSIKYNNAIWHGLVLSATFCHFIAIAHAFV